MNSKEFSSYRALWSAVVLRAFSDMLPHENKTSKPIIKDTGDPKENRKRYRNALKKRRLAKEEWEVRSIKARVWIFCLVTAPGSFLWICKMLDLNPKRLRQKAKTPKGIQEVVAGGKLYEDQK